MLEVLEGLRALAARGEAHGSTIAADLAAKATELAEYLEKQIKGDSAAASSPRSASADAVAAGLGRAAIEAEGAWLAKKFAAEGDKPASEWRGVREAIARADARERVAVLDPLVSVGLQLVEDLSRSTEKRTTLAHLADREALARALYTAHLAPGFGPAEAWAAADRFFAFDPRPKAPSAAPAAPEPKAPGDDAPEAGEPDAPPAVPVQPAEEARA